MSDLSHDDLVLRAEAWLRSKGHAVIITDMASGSRETPDAIGWRCAGGHSTLLECKTSRADFIADRKKFFRVDPEQGMGNYRYMMVPDGMVTEIDLPDGWGLLSINGKRVRIDRGSALFKMEGSSERALLCSALRRMVVTPGVKGVNCKTYVIDSAGESPRATVGVTPEETSA